MGFLFDGDTNKMREPRVYKQDSVYHITVRASNRELLFCDDSDYAYFLEILKARKEKYNFKLYAYCLLPKHYHLLIEPTQTETQGAPHSATLSKIMQAINTSYSLYFNKKYNRFGHLISGRFQCRSFNKDGRLLHQSVYLHLNPVRLGLTQKTEDYKWSSYAEYVDAAKPGITDKDYILSFMRDTPPANREGVPIGDSLGFGSRGVPEKYKQLVEELEVVRTPGVAEKRAHKKIKYKVGYGIALAGLIGVLIILPHLMNMRGGSGNNLNLKGVPTEGTLSRLAQEPSLVNLPEGLPLYNIGKAQDKIQVWEAWKLGPLAQGESDGVAQ